jgi:hypothetical protein
MEIKFNFFHGAKKQIIHCIFKITKKKFLKAKKTEMEENDVITKWEQQWKHAFNQQENAKENHTPSQTPSLLHLQQSQSRTSVQKCPCENFVLQTGIRCCFCACSDVVEKFIFSSHSSGVYNRSKQHHHDGENKEFGEKEQNTCKPHDITTASTTKYTEKTKNSNATRIKEPMGCRFYESSALLELVAFLYTSLLIIIIIFGSIFASSSGNTGRTVGEIENDDTNNHHDLLFHVASLLVPILVLHARFHVSRNIVNGALVMISIGFVFKITFIVQSLFYFASNHCSTFCLEHPLIFLLQILLSALLVVLDVCLFFKLLNYRVIIALALRATRK